MCIENSESLFNTLCICFKNTLKPLKQYYKMCQQMKHFYFSLFSSKNYDMTLITIISAIMYLLVVLRKMEMFDILIYMYSISLSILQYKVHQDPSNGKVLIEDSVIISTPITFMFTSYSQCPIHLENLFDKCI